MCTMDKCQMIEEGQFSYIETQGSGDTILLLHGLLGELSNFDGIFNRFSKDYNIVFPILPIFTYPLRKVSLTGLLDYIEAFVEYKGYDKLHVVGNSLGGHLAQLFTLRCPDKVQSLILTGSSGLFENAMGSTFPKRGNYDYIKQKAEETFYDPEVATKELVDTIFEATTNRNKAIRIIATAKSAVRHNLADKLNDIEVPVLLIWGKQDKVTPPFVAEKFNDLLPNATLKWVDKCGHAPMMEHPKVFNEYLKDFIESHQIVETEV